MGVLIFLMTLLIAVSSATACDRCLHQSKVSFFSSDQPLQSGACGYGSLATGFNGGRLAGAVPSIYNGGAGCGACFQMKCKDAKICSPEGTTIIVTDLNNDDRTDFVLSSRAFMAMAKTGSGRELLKRGLVDVDYKRIPCDYKKNLTIRVEESSQKQNNYLAIKILYQGGQTEIVRMNVDVESSSWGSTAMSRNYGAVWDVSGVPNGALKIGFRVTVGYDDGIWYWAEHALPADWKNGGLYDSGLQINDIAQERCPTCDNSTTWKR